MPNAFIIIGPQLKKLCTEIITQAGFIRNVGGTAVVIFAPSKHQQYNLHSSHMAVYKQATGAYRCRKVVI